MMRNRNLPIFVGIGILCLCGFIFFWGFGSQNQSPITIYKSIPESEPEREARKWHCV